MQTVIDRARDQEYQRQNNVGGSARYTIFPAGIADPHIRTAGVDGSVSLSGTFPTTDYNRIVSQTYSRAPGAGEPNHIPPSSGA